MNLTEVIDTVRNGGKRIDYENADYVIAVYSVGANLIRCDFKLKG